MVPVTLGVSALLTLPCLFAGFCYDDAVQRLLLEGKVLAFGRPWLALYDFTPPRLGLPALVEVGRLPWFADPGFSLRFMRPGASLLMAIEHEIFGRNSFALHVHSMLWLLALVAIAARLYQRWFSPSAAKLSALIFACSGVFTMPTAWIAARHALVAAALGAAALLSWVRYREDHWRPGLGLAVAALVASLFCSEVGLTTIPFLVCLGASLQREAATTAELGDCAREGDIYVLSGSEARIGKAAFTLPFHREEGAAVGRVHVLSMLPKGQRLHGISSGSFELEVLGGEREPTVSELVFRSADRPLRAGMGFEYETFRVDVIDTTKGLFKRLRVTLKTGEGRRRSCLLRGAVATCEPWPCRAQVRA